MAGMRRILFASDFSKASGKAFTSAVSMAKANKATLTVLHVVAPMTPVTPDQYIGPETWQQIEAENKRWTTRKLAELTAKARKAGVRVAVLLADGNPAKHIVRIAKAGRFDLVVIGTHGRTGLAKFFLGSVAGRVVATAPCPVLTVRSRE
jgi:nucleotide-binding universal stress UspA family protein